MANHNVGTRAEYAPLAPTMIAGEAMFSGCLCTIDLARSVIASYLPDRVALPPEQSATHPCLLAFGEQSAGTTFFGGFSVPWGIRYHELMVAVPFVTWMGAAGLHLFVTGMACDFWPAVWNGNVYYGFKKRFARMAWSGDRFTVGGEAGQSGFDAVLHSRPDAPPAVHRIRAAVALPVLGCRMDGVFVRSRFDWDFRASVVEGASLEIPEGQRLPELPAMAPAARNVDACRVRGMIWRLGWPGPCFNLPDA
jgi:hypothetical protein